MRRNDAIAAAISGSVEREPDAIETTAFGDTCADEQHALVREVADAQTRAQRTATGLGASIALAPVAARTGAGIGFAPCTDRGMEYTPPTPLSEHISGDLQRRTVEVGKVSSLKNARKGADCSVRWP